MLSFPSGTSADLRAETITSFDEQGQGYQTQVYSVDPTSGSVSSTALMTSLTDWASGTSYADADSVTGDHGHFIRHKYDFANMRVSRGQPAVMRPRS